MSDFTQKDGQGVLFKNERKKSEKHPDYTGSFTFGGKRHALAGWMKQGKKGPFMSLAVSEWRDRSDSDREPGQDDEPRRNFF